MARGAHIARQEGRQPGATSRWPRRLLIGANILVAVSLVGAGSTLAYVNWRYGQVRRITLPGLVHRGQDSAGATLQEPVSAVTILLVGSNTRTGLNPKEANAFGSAEEVGGARSDVTMLLRLDPKSGASILSIPRDLFVPMPPGTSVGSAGKIDGALNDGPEKLVEAIENDLGIPIDHYVEVNFDGFQSVVSTLGGISMDFPTPLRDAYSSLNITQTGCLHLGGFQALAVVRARHLQFKLNGRWQDDPESDLSRIRRDHEFLSVFVKALQAKGLNNPLRANAVLGDLVHQVTIDSGLTLPTLIHLIQRYGNLNPDTVPQTTLPVTEVSGFFYRGTNIGDVVFPSFPEDAQVIGAFLGGLGRPVTAKPSVQVEDISGLGLGRKISAGLVTEGFDATASRYASVPSRPTETVIGYHPGEVNAAESVLASLRGAAIMDGDPKVASGTVVVEVGSVIAANPPTGESLFSSATTVPSVTTTAPGATTTVATPTPGGQPISPAVTPLAPFDPTACPAKS
jgi:LCP family protein required for cell wall assembly